MPRKQPVRFRVPWDFLFVAVPSEAAAQFQRQHAQSGLGLEKCQPLQDPHDERWRTATVELVDAAFKNRQRTRVDFCIS